jgi:hypothetical protein
MGQGLSFVMTRTTYHENPHDNDAKDDKDESSGIVSLLVDRKCSFFGMLYIINIYSNSPKTYSCDQQAETQYPTTRLRHRRHHYREDFREKLFLS